MLLTKPYFEYVKHKKNKQIRKIKRKNSQEYQYNDKFENIHMADEESEKMLSNQDEDEEY